MYKKRIIGKKIINKSKYIKLICSVLWNIDSNRAEIAIKKYILIDFKDLNTYLSIGFVLKKAYKDKYLISQISTILPESLEKIVLFYNKICENHGKNQI